MSDWIGLGVIVAVVLIALIALSQLGKKQPPMTEEEFEKRRQEGTGVMSAGMMGLQQILDPQTAKAVAVQHDFKQGLYDVEQETGKDLDAEEKDKQEKNVGEESLGLHFLPKRKSSADEINEEDEDDDKAKNRD